MNVPKWLVGVWLAQVLFSSSIYFWTVAFVGLSGLLRIAAPYLISATYWGTVSITVVWFLWKRASAARRLYVILWIVALFISAFVSSLAPARAGETNSLPYIAPPVTLAVAAATTLIVWAARKFHKPRATQNS